MTLDGFDQRILEIVQENADLTAEELSERVPISPSAIQRRLRRMRREGAIQRHVAVVDPRRVGRPMCFVVSVVVERETPEKLARFRAWLLAEPRVQQVFYVTGETDYILIVTAPDAEVYDALMARMVGDNPNVKRFQTQVALNVVKRGLAVPCEGAETGGGPDGSA